VLARDVDTAKAFATSWNNLPGGSVYTHDQFSEWMKPLQKKDFEGKEVLELGCGNASLLVHSSRWGAKRVVGVDLGDSVLSARQNMDEGAGCDWVVEQADLVKFDSAGFDVVYCIGVLHHLKSPRAGFDAVLRNVRHGGAFHCWVYGWEGNAVIRFVVEPIRRLACRLPWWVTKYLLAAPLVAPYYIYAKLIKLLAGQVDGAAPWFAKWLPLYEYSLWISKREFAFFHHVAFDQLVTPQTCYLRKSELELWLREHPEVDPGSTYLIFRNGNSWKFGGRRKQA